MRARELTMIRVLFATTVYDDVATGPTLYARYLWEAFRNDPDIEFHLIAPSIDGKHPQLHALDATEVSSRFAAGPP